MREVPPESPLTEKLAELKGEPPTMVTLAGTPATPGKLELRVIVTSPG
jgi:hypothetical protein